MNNMKQCYIMGLPNAGKTTFLAALWHSLVNASSENKLKLNSMGNANYLADISKKWVNAQEIERTKLGYDIAEISIEIIDDNDNVFKLKFPDLSGETFQNQYEKREITDDLAEYIRTSDGILIFVNILDVNSATFIAEIPNDFRKSNDENSIVEKNHLIRNPKSDDPVQVQIIELLQFVDILRKGKICNLGIVLSAWDLIKEIKTEVTPEKFLKSQMNMLWQFLQSNKNLFETNYWGVSAQGGDLSLKDDLLNIVEPVNRILVVDNSGQKSNDITIPLYKVMGE